MINIVGRRTGSASVPVNGDTVIVAYPLPQGGIFNQLDLGMKLVSNDAVQPLTAVSMYGVDGYVVPVPDPDDTPTYRQAWDRFVPKDDVMTVGVDLDTTTEDQSPVMVEGGGIDLNALFDMTGLAPKRFFRRRMMVGFADGLPGVGSQGASTFIASDRFQTRMNPRIRVSQHSLIMIGISSPNLSLTSATQWVPPADESEWAILQYIEKFMEDAFIASLVLTEAGAESPYEDVEAYIGRLLEDVIFEETAQDFLEQIWHCHARSAFNISVPGRLTTGRTLSSDMG